MVNPVETMPADKNPLLEIDLSFSAYLSARTRSFKEHVVGGKLDYAHDVDFSLRQKINGMSGWAKIYRKLTGTDIPNNYKRVFQSASAASALLYPEAFDAAQVCAERLKISVPAVYVRNIPDKLDIYSLSAPDVEDCVIITSGLYESCDREELRFLVGRECGHIQNNHCVYNQSAPYFDKGDEEEGDASALKPLEVAMVAWFRHSAITSDRAGIICCDEPRKFADIFESLYQKGVVPKKRKFDEFLDMEKLKKEFVTLKKTPARNISLDSGYTFTDRRVFAGMEFLFCETLYNWRPDLDKSDVHTINKQTFEVRCDIIIGEKDS
jgi:hypothetical protein